jgi:hypothetical protein
MISDALLKTNEPDFRTGGLMEACSEKDPFRDELLRRDSHHALAVPAEVPLRADRRPSVQSSAQGAGAVTKGETFGASPFTLN